MRKMMLILIFTVGLLQTFSSARAAGICEDLFSPTKVKSASIFDSWIQASLHSTQVLPKRDSFILRTQERLLLLRLNSNRLDDDGYRNWFVDQLVDLKIREQFTLFEDYELSKKESRLAARRMILQKAIRDGLGDWMEQRENQKPWSFIDSLVNTVRFIRFQPVLRPFFEFRLPQKTYLLTSEQMQLILRDGERAFLKEPSLRALLGEQKQEANKEAVRRTVTRIVAVGLIVASGFYLTPIVAADYDQGFARGKKEAALRMDEAVKPIDTNAYLLKMAKDQVIIITDTFTKKYGVTPSSSQHSDILKHVCTVNMAGSLTPEFQSRCLAL